MLTSEKKIINSKDFVKVVFQDTETLKINIFKSKYLVGCDGANSITRKSIKSKFNNLGFTQKWAVIDLILNKKKNLPDRTIQYSNPKRPATYCRNVGKRRRWEFALKKNENEQEHEKHDHQQKNKVRELSFFLLMLL